MSFVVADNLTKTYGSGASTVTAIEDIEFNLEAGEFVAVMGESGAGKSTLLSVLGAMNTPTRGRFSVDGIDVYALCPERRADFRREYLGFVFQSFHLLNYLNVVENVMLPLTTIKMNNGRKKEMAMAALDWVGLSSKARRLPQQISGGEKERVAIARAIVNNPPVLLADEPTGNLDSGTTEEIMSLMGRLNADGTTVVMVTHSAACAAHAQRILSVADGRLRQDRSTAAGPVRAGAVKAA